MAGRGSRQNSEPAQYCTGRAGRSGHIPARQLGMKYQGRAEVGQKEEQE